MLKILQNALPKLWTDELYSEEFRKYPCPYKDFDHALKHVGKAHARLSAMTEEADHLGALPGKIFKQEDLEKYIADLIISTVRLAIVAPGGPIDIERAVRSRIETKMGALLP